MTDITVTLYSTLLALDELTPEQRQAAIAELRKCLDSYEAHARLFPIQAAQYVGRP